MSRKINSPGSNLINNSESIDAIRDYWDSNLHDHEVTVEPEGSVKFFEDLENYHYEKLEYLPRVMEFDSYANKDVLEVGCGVGIDLIRFAKIGACVTGIDLAEKNINLAIENFKLHEVNGELLVMNGEEMSFSDNLFDMVFAHGVLAYTANAEKMISEIHRVLKPGGKAILMMYNSNSWLYYLSKVMNFKLGREDAPVFNTYSKTEFQDMLKDFSNIKIQIERFPVETRIHKGFFAQIYNIIVVPIFKFIPKALVKPLGAHLIAISVK